MNNSLIPCVVESGFKCIWKIQNFDIYNPKWSIIIRSDSFKVPMLLNSEWRLELNLLNSNSINLRLYKIKGDTQNNNIDFNISLFTRSGWHEVIQCLDKKFNSGGCGHTINNFINLQQVKNPKNGYLFNRYLIIGVCMENGSTKNKAVQYVMTSEVCDSGVSAPLTWLNKLFSDLTPGEIVELPLSNLSLYAVSKENNGNNTSSNEKSTKSTQTQISSEEYSVEFKRTFFSLAKENQMTAATKNDTTKPKFQTMNNILISDMKNPNILKEDGNFMSFLLQSVQPELLSDMTWDASKRLYYASRKYNVTNLKKKSILLLGKKLSLVNICETFLIADTQQDDELKQQALEYFVKNSKAVLLSLEWKDLKKKRPELTLEILSEFAEKLQN